MRAGTLAAATVLDLVLGDPRWLPHPVQIVGALVALVDRRRPVDLSSRATLALGAGLTLATTAIAWSTGRWADRAPRPAAVLVAASTLAIRSLDDAVRAVADALRREDIEAARRATSSIVGRDTADLDSSEIARAALETLAESLCDGVVAPLFYLRLGGCAAALAFKAISTLDSMIGHPEMPYTWFGRIAARADDVANLVPARIAAAAIALAALLCGADARGALRCTFADASKHRSPNAGWPEAALAGALGIRLGGANAYAGIHTPGAMFNATARRARAGDIARGLRIVRIAGALCAGAAIAA
jgi:adenosylcobinamide-phosphate synthase